MLWLFALTMLASATLLFVVQPMFAKMVLPLFGGTPNVWNTCMVFYQAVLLAGYLYAHLSLRMLGARRQALLHLILLAAPCLMLPIAVSGQWVPPGGANPVPWLLMLLTVSLGLPLFVVSGSAPLLQAWFANTTHPAARDPYFLYAASNVGSIAALLAYPILIEPHLTLFHQTIAWTVGFAALALLTAGCALVLWHRPAESSAPLPQVSRDGKLAAEHRTLWRTRLGWLVLALVPSSMLLGVTTHISTDIASVPLLWAIPLVLYLLTFVLTFARHRLIPQSWMVRLQPFLVVPVAASFYVDASRAIWPFVPLHLLMFFVTAMVCHGELAARRPEAGRLTEFYIFLSLGGVLGGALNALIAPVLFTSVIEYPLAIVLACLLRPGKGWTGEGARSRAFDIVLPAALAFALGRVAYELHDLGQAHAGAAIGVLLILAAVLCLGFQGRPLRFGLGVAAVMVIGLSYASADSRVVYAERSFFGVVRVRYDRRHDAMVLVHGSTNHGMQSCDPRLRDDPLTYFHRTGPLGQLFAALNHREPPREIGVIGLGTGSIAAYGRPGQHFTFFEIDPAVEQIARDPEYFTFLRDSPAEVDVILGDARLTLAEVPDGHFDLLILDAFSSDAIPIHLATREALHLYLRKLAPHGVLVLHISNRYLDLRPILARLADDAGLVCRIEFETRVSEAEEAEGKLASCWAVMARRPEPIEGLAEDPRWKKPPVASSFPLWTDDFSNIFSVLKW